jgi:hypothetical protein
LHNPWCRFVAAEQVVSSHRECADKQNARQPYQHCHKRWHDFQKLLPAQNLITEVVVKQREVHGPPGHHSVHRRAQ